MNAGGPERYGMRDMYDITPLSLSGTRTGAPVPGGFGRLLEGRIAEAGSAAGTVPEPADRAGTAANGGGTAAGAPANGRTGGAANGAAAPALIDRESELYKQCEALETFLIKNILTGMRNTIQKSGFIDEGFAGKIYEDMLYDEYAKDFTKNAGFGLAGLAYLELTGQRGKSAPRDGS